MAEADWTWTDLSFKRAVQDVAKIRAMVREELKFSDWAENSITEEILVKYVAAAIALYQAHEERKI